MAEVSKPVYCPRCDRQKPNLAVLREHIAEAHPEFLEKFDDE